MASCPNCGARLARKARFCPQCGERVDEGDTRVDEWPADETGEVPVHVMRSEAHVYGVAPATLVLGVAVVALAAAVVLFSVGRWPFGLILLGVAILFLLLFLEAARRRPAGTASRSAVDAVAGFRARAGVAADAVATRGRTTRQVYALRRELQRLASARRGRLLELGEAVYRGDDEATKAARDRIEELDGLAAQREAEMQKVVAAAGRRLEQRRFEVQPTEIAEAPQEPQEPAPGELNPPEPARIPEPYPPPDEATPPQPAVIPEPGPAVIPEPGPQGEEGR